MDKLPNHDKNTWQHPDTKKAADLEKKLTAQAETIEVLELILEAQENTIEEVCEAVQEFVNRCNSGRIHNPNTKAKFEKILGVVNGD